MPLVAAIAAILGAIAAFLPVGLVSWEVITHPKQVDAIFDAGATIASTAAPGIGSGVGGAVQGAGKGIQGIGEYLPLVIGGVVLLAVLGRR